MIQRIFDIIEQKATQHPEKTMLAAKVNGIWETITCKTVWDKANLLAGAIQNLGISTDLTNEFTQEKIAIISPNRPEWIITDTGVQLAGAALTPIYPTISPTELEYVLNEAEVRIVFIANQDIYDRYKDAFKNIDKLKFIYSFDVIEGVDNWNTLLQKNIQPDRNLIENIKSENLATIIYTSGTTGNPKGVMLTHKNIVSNINDSLPVFTFVEENGKALSFLPLNHIFERMVSYIYLISGVSIYYAESMDTIGLNLKEVQPMVFTTVPRLLEKVYERIYNTGLELKGIKRALFFWSLNLARKYDNNKSGGFFYDLQLNIANKLVFKKWREALGGKVKAIVVGSAATQERLVRIFSAAQIVIMEGYGLTETSPVISVNHFESENRRVGSIGPLIQNVQVKLAEDGEILAKGNNITPGYFKHPEITKEAFDAEGWFHTGDIGQWVEGRFLKITDRKKEIFKTSGGKYVAPQVVENKLKESPYIEQILVIGDGKKFVSALIVPNFTHIKKSLKDHNGMTNIPSKNSEIIELNEAKAIIQKQIDKYNPFFSHPEQVKKFELLADEWTINNGELTPSLKVKRKVVLAKFSHLIDRMYGE